MKKEIFTESIAQRKEEWNESIEEHRGNIENRVEELRDNIEERLQSIRRLNQAGNNKYLENAREELFELRLKYRESWEERKRLSHLKDFFQRDMLRAHPSMSSTRFKEALEELKRRAVDGKDED